MRRHISRAVLLRLFSGAFPQAEADIFLPHLSLCNRCRSLAVEVVTELRRSRELAALDADRAAFFALIREEERRAVELLKARGWWSELRELQPDAQLERVRSQPRLQTISMFETMLEEARSLSSSDPYLAEQQALAAQAVADLLPVTRFSPLRKSDRQGEALIVVANCRRLLANWTGSLSALAAAKSHLKRGTGDPLLTARLFSIHASLACDTGRTEMALDLLDQAGEILRKEDEVEELSACLVKRAGTLLADNKPEEALVQASKALRLVTDVSPRKEMLARAIIVESLVELERPTEAVRAYMNNQRLFDEQAVQGGKLRVLYLEARLLNCLDCMRESEKLFLKVIEGYLEADLYKESFTVALTLFELYFKRSLLDKAASLCQVTIERLQRCGGHEQMIAVWGELLRLVVNQLLERRHLVEARQYLARHWYRPAASPPFSGMDGKVLEHKELRLEPELLLASPSAPEPQEVAPGPESRTSGSMTEGLHIARERFEREFISETLSQTGGRIREAHRILQISRNGLKAKMRKYGLVGGKEDSE